MGVLWKLLKGLAGILGTLEKKCVHYNRALDRLNGADTMTNKSLLKIDCAIRLSHVGHRHKTCIHLNKYYNEHMILNKINIEFGADDPSKNKIF